MATESDTTEQQPKRTKTTHNHNRTSNPIQDSNPNPNPILPREIIIEILSRLSVKSLLQFRSVSKTWRSIISDPQFIKTHLKISTRNNNYSNYKLILSSTQPQFNLKSCSLYSVFNESSVEALELDYPLKNPHDSVWIVGSCNGLLCIAIEEDAIFLWNPSTRKSKRLPNSGISIGFGCYIIYGFGYNQSTDDYKVVGIFCVFRNGGSYEIEVKVYTLRTDCWRRIQDFPFGIPLDDSGKFANGALHWAASRDIGSGSSYSWILISLDLAKEAYSEVSQPTYGEGDFDLTLGVLGECLCVLCNYSGARADIWVMKEYGVRESWTKLVTIPYLIDPGRCQYSVPLCISKNGEILLELGYSLGLYNPKDNTFKYLAIRNLDVCLEANTFIESLVSTDVDNGAERQHQ